MDFFITWTVVLGFLVVPALINYFANRYYAPPGASVAPTLELMIASLVLTFAVIVADIVGVLLLSLYFDDLKEEIADFMQLGLVDYGQDRPIALTGVLSAVSLAYMAALALLGVFRIPSRFVR